jgi:hypothetical protein
MGAGSTEDCATCLCTACATELDACVNDADASANPSSTKTQGEQCKAVVSCSNRAGCEGDACFGGLLGGGPCQAEIMDTFTGGFPNMTDSTTAGHPLYNANAIGTCKMANCQAECQ